MLSEMRYKCLGLEDNVVDPTTKSNRIFTPTIWFVIGVAILVIVVSIKLSQ